MLDKILTEKFRRTLKMVFLAVGVCFLFSFITGQPVLAKDKKEILLGAHQPLSGFGASVGADQKWAYDMAMADINKAGGIYVKEYGKKLPIRFEVYDDARFQESR